MGTLCVFQEGPHRVTLSPWTLCWEAVTDDLRALQVQGHPVEVVRGNPQGVGVGLWSPPPRPTCRDVAGSTVSVTEPGTAHEDSPGVCDL